MIIFKIILYIKGLNVLEKKLQKNTVSDIQSLIFHHLYHFFCLEFINKWIPNLCFFKGVALFCCALVSLLRDTKAQNAVTLQRAAETISINQEPSPGNMGEKAWN